MTFRRRGGDELIARWGSRGVDGLIVCSLLAWMVFAARPRGNSHARTFGLALCGVVAVRLLGAPERPSAAVDEATSNASSTLVSIVAHEIRAPLAAIRGAVALLDEHEPDLDQTRRRDLLAVALDASRALGFLVDDLLLVSRIAGGRLLVEREPVDLVSLVREAANAELSHTVTVVEQDGVPNVLGDPLRVRQVVTNLLSNAITNASESSIVLASIALHDDGVRVTIFNDGRGIAPEEQSRLFLPFVSLGERRVDSTGLGLYIAKELVDAMDGTIGFDTQPGRNAAFWFTLKVAPPLDALAHPRRH